MGSLEYIRSFDIGGNIGRFKGGYLFKDEIERNGFLLNPENGCSIILSSELCDQLYYQNIEEPLAFKMIQRGLIERGNCLECQVKERVQPTFFIFDLTQACNFRCIYCFRHLEDKVRTISDKNLDAITNYIIDYCIKYKIKNFCVQPWGGEPLIAFDKIRRMDNMFKEKGLYPLISIETNASLITEELAEECAIRNIRLGVSIDGFELVQNMHRPLMNGKPSFEKMMRGVKILANNENLKNFGVVTVLTSKSFPYLKEIIEFLATEVKVSCFKLNLVKDNPVMKDAGLCLTKEQVELAEITLLSKLVELNKRGYPITELNVQEKLMNLLVRSKSNICTSRGCMGGTKMIAFDQDGLIYPCDVTDYKKEAIGSVHDKQDLITLVNNAKKSNCDFFNKKHINECDNCPFWFYCKGGCTTAIKYKKGCVEGVDNQECIANKTLYPKLIELILSEPNAIFPLTRGRVKLNKI
ncbi:MAG: radical SAM protein [Bacteroidales bacterium]|nr:radical SAM protein [Bacteroidales bacterium]